MSKHTPTTWRHEESTKTIRSVPGNYWIATMDSWDGACNHNANARLIAAAPELLNLANMVADISDHKLESLIHHQLVNLIRDIRNESKSAIAKATGESA